LISAVQQKLYDQESLSKMLAQEDPVDETDYLADSLTKKNS
jgi:hypothetical protein